MTAEEWKQLEESISLYQYTRLIVDGNELTLIEARSGNKISIMVYINGSIKGGESEENKRKYWYERKMSVYNGKRKSEMEKLSKVFRRKLQIDLDKKVSMRVPYFPSFRALKSQLSKNNESIEFKKSE